MIFLKNLICIVFMAFFVASCSGGGGGGGAKGSSDEPPISNDLPKNSLATNILQEIEFKELGYKMISPQVVINQDASKVMIAFHNNTYLWVLQYRNGEWLEPIALGDNGDVGSSTAQSFKLIMNDNGQAALINYADFRVGTAETFALSYFDGNDWIYTVEVEGIGNKAFTDKVISHIDDSGNVYIAYPNNRYAPVTLSVAKFDRNGATVLGKFDAEKGYTIGPYAIDVNKNDNIMVLYRSNNGYTAIFNGNTWRISQNWMVGADPGKLNYRDDGNAFLVYGDLTVGWLKYQYYNGETQKWKLLYEEQNYKRYYAGWDDHVFDKAVAINESWDEMMFVYEEFHTDYSETFLNSRLYANYYHNGIMETTEIFRTSWRPQIFFHEKGAYVVLFCDNSNRNEPMIRYYYHGKWSNPEYVSHQWIQPNYFMNKHGYVAFTNGYMVSIAKFNDSLLQ